ncbi:hypothetical protein SCT_0349 [Sulfuricella sp. T08]|uniref:hypothetical protein n=1 Tax=Sulfuricella sp. T08 TaxID=1632857 RepID=UPI0006179D16|nr:hypothetical protein [Sulfuricella sp. T08]GAO34969.1 hypothetical protein SCT_0349 [Sulfuricella sp. T08]
MEPDHHEVYVNKKSSQAAILLARLEILRDELGMVGEDLINLLRNAGVVPLAETDSERSEKAGGGLEPASAG